MGMAAILVMWPGPFEQTFVPHPKESPYGIWVQLAQWFQRRRCLKMLTDDGRTTDGRRTDDGRRSHWYTNSSPRSLRLRWAKNEGARVVTTLSINFLRWSRRANSIIEDGILKKFKLIQAFIVVLLICKNKEDPLKIESTRVVTTFLPLLVYGDFSRCSKAANLEVLRRILQKFKIIQSFMSVLVR